MAASINDKFRKSYSLLTKSLSAGISDVDTTIPFNNVTNIPTDTAVDFIIDRVDSNGTATPTLRELCKGVVSGSNLINCVRGVHGTTAQSHLSGAVVEFIVSASAHNDMIDALLTSLTQAGDISTTNTATFAAHIDVNDSSTAIRDTSDNELLKFAKTASAVNEVTVTNAATTTPPKLSASGGDTNIDLQIAGKGDTGSPRFYGNYDGWNLDSDTWTYASATTFTIASKDVTARFPVGTKIKLTQTTAKYFYVTGTSFSTNTTVTVTGGSDYTLANAAITLPHYSYEETPQGFPQWFNYTPSWTNFTVGSATVSSKFAMTGKDVQCHIDVTLNSSTMGSGPYFTLPVTSISYSGTSTTQPIGALRLFDAAPATALGGVYWRSTTTAELQLWNASGTYLSTSTITSTVPWTWANSDEFHIQCSYETA